MMLKLMSDDVWFSEMHKKCKDLQQMNYYLKFLPLINQSFEQIYSTYMSEKDADSAYCYTLRYAKSTNIIVLTFPKIFETAVIHLMDEINI